MHENKIITLVVEKEFLEVGRNTVREAVRILVSRNIVTVRQGSGTFISEKQGTADCKLRTQQCHVQSGSSDQPVEAERAMQYHLLYNENRYLEEDGFFCAKS